MGCLYGLWILFIALTVVSYPFVRRFRLWQAEQRFILRQGALMENPDNAEARFQLASIYAKGKRWRRAAEAGWEAVEAAGRNPLYDGKVPYPFLLLLGDALYHAHRYDEAIEIYTRALSSKAEFGHADAQFGLGKSHYRMGDAEKAVDLYRAVLKDFESNLEAYFRWAQAAALLGRQDEVEAARAAFHRVARMMPGFARQRRFRMRLAFLFFPIARRIA